MMEEKVQAINDRYIMPTVAACPVWSIYRSFIRAGFVTIQRALIFGTPSGAQRWAGGSNFLKFSLLARQVANTDGRLNHE